MSIDTAQFVATFLEESMEGLDLMESSLINFRSDDPELINQIFRAAHSIKGGAGTFGFSAVSDFTHGVETLLDQMRNGQRPMTEETVGTLLEAVDCIREMLAAARDGASIDPGRIADLQERIHALLGATPSSANQTAAAPVGQAWCIRFHPHRNMLRSGNEPARMFAVLREMGSLTVSCDSSALPELAALEPEACYLGWTLHLAGRVTEAEISAVFDWVSDECELSITPTGGPSDDRPPEAVASATRIARSGMDRRADGGSIRVAVEKVDALMNMVGELVITQSMLTQIGADADDLDLARLEKLRTGLAQLERNTRELQESVMGIRMLPINFIFSRFPRLIRDTAAALNKSVSLRLIGEETELDKGMIEKLSDPLTHLVRNAIDHGIEPPDRRLAGGKPAEGQITLRAGHQGGNIVVEISDDGAGLDRGRLLAKAAALGMPVNENMADREVWQLIFAPGFSTAEKVTDLSGRGVGMDVVRRNIEDINGRVDIDSEPGKGTRITIRLPLTLAILDGMSIRVGTEVFILPMTTILESIQPAADQLRPVSGRGLVVHLRGEYLPVIPVHQVFGLEPRVARPEDGILVIVEGGTGKAALFVDDLVAQHQVVIKSLETNYRRVAGVSGATIMGDGHVALILDVDALIRLGRGD